MHHLYSINLIAYDNSSRSDDWTMPLNLADWIDLNDAGPYLGDKPGEAVKIYKKLLDRGYHSIDDTSAFYLFEFKGEPYDEFKCIF